MRAFAIGALIGGFVGAPTLFESRRLFDWTALAFVAPALIAVAVGIFRPDPIAYGIATGAFARYLVFSFESTRMCGSTNAACAAGYINCGPGVAHPCSLVGPTLFVVAAALSGILLGFSLRGSGCGRIAGVLAGTAALGLFLTIVMQFLVFIFVFAG